MAWKKGYRILAGLLAVLLVLSGSLTERTYGEEFPVSGKTKQTEEKKHETEKVMNLKDGSFTYKLSKDGKSLILTKYSGKKTTVTIPAKVKGYPVTEIGSGVFEGNKKLKKVVLPASIKKIGARAFKNCTGLKSVSVNKAGTLPGSLTEIGQEAFYGAKGIKELTLPNKLTKIGARAFAKSVLQRVFMPASVKSIGTGAFEGCKVVGYGKANTYGWKYMLTAGFRFEETDTVGKMKSPQKTYTGKNWKKGWGTKIDDSMLGKPIRVTNKKDGGFVLTAPKAGDYVFSVYAPNIGKSTFNIRLYRANKNVLQDRYQSGSMYFEKSAQVQSRLYRGVAAGEKISFWLEDGKKVGSAFTKPVILKITRIEPSKGRGKTGEVTIEKQPASLSVLTDYTAHFTVEAVNVKSYTWQESKNNGETWTDAIGEGANSKTLSVPAKEANNGKLYRCLLKGKQADDEMLTNEALLTVVKPAATEAWTSTDTVLAPSKDFSKPLVVDADGSWTVSSAPSWIRTIVTENSLTLKLDENKTSSTRTGKVVISADVITSDKNGVVLSIEKNALLLREITVVQEYYVQDTSFRLAPTKVSIFGSSGAWYRFLDIYCDSYWQITDKPNWVSLRNGSSTGAQVSSGYGNNLSSIYIVATEYNYGTTSKVGEITIESQGRVRKVLVMQQPKNTGSKPEITSWFIRTKEPAVGESLLFTSIGFSNTDTLRVVADSEVVGNYSVGSSVTNLSVRGFNTPGEHWVYLIPMKNGVAGAAQEVQFLVKGSTQKEEEEVVEIKVKNPVDGKTYEDNHTYEFDAVNVRDNNALFQVIQNSKFAKYTLIVYRMDEAPDLKKPLERRGYMIYNTTVTGSTLKDWDKQYGGIPIAFSELVNGSYIKFAVGGYFKSDATGEPDVWTVFSLKVKNNSTTGFEAVVEY